MKRKSPKKKVDVLWFLTYRIPKGGNHANPEQRNHKMNTKNARIPRMISGKKVFLKQKFKGQPVDQVYNLKHGWSNINDVVDEALVATLKHFNKGQIKLHFCGDIAGDFELSEIIE